jgi:hypothetical protein
MDEVVAVPDVFGDFVVVGLGGSAAEGGYAAPACSLRCARSPSLARLLASLGAWLEGAAAWALSPWLEVRPLSTELSLGCGVG